MSTGPIKTHSWADNFMEADQLFFQLISMVDSLYVWVGAEDARLDSLALGVPAPRSSGSHRLPTGTTLLSTGADSGSQQFAQRLTKKLGHPVFVSLNIKDDMQLRLYAEKKVVEAISRLHKQSDAPATSALPSVEELAIGAPVVPLVVSAQLSTVVSSVIGTETEESRGARTRAVFKSQDELSSSACQLLLEAASAAISQRGGFSIALSGGSIPALLSPGLLVGKPVADFSRWHVFMADER